MVDDSERNLLVASEVLNTIANTVCAHSSKEALRCLLWQEFTVILHDDAEA